MPSKNPFAVLEVPADASEDAIKAAWRRLARLHHPDVTSGDQTVERRATRRMAEINAAYHELRDPDRRRLYRDEAARSGFGAGGAASPGEAGADYTNGAASTPPGWVSPRRSRPVTARIDTSALLRPRNATLFPQDRSSLPGHAPRPRSAEDREPPRASDPTGPTHRRPGPNMEADLPTLAAALDVELGFGKFAGLTLGDVADLEPSYVDWIVRTISREPELLLAARVVQRYLERTGVIRRQRLDNTVPRARGI
jgi:curved DNA-binding protein CbpA